MIHFDSNRKIKALKGDLGVRYSLGYPFEKATAQNALWAMSDGFAADAVLLIVLSIVDDIDKLLRKAEFWISQAIEQKEERRGFGAESKRFQHKLFSNIRWLADATHDSKSLEVWLHETIKCFRVDPERVHSASLGLEAVTFIDAGAHQEFIALAAPAGIDAIKCSGANEKQMALTLAAQALTQKFPEDKVQATVKKFLDNHVGKWLNDGHAVRAAEWMKVIYWKRGEAGLSPFEAVRKCLDHVEY